MSNAGGAGGASAGGAGGEGEMGAGGEGGSAPVTHDAIAYSTGMRVLSRQGGTYFSVRYPDALGQYNTYVATSTDGVT